MALETEDLTLSRAVLSSGVAAVLADPSKGRYYVAESAGQVVGQLMITYEWSDWRNGSIWWVQSVYVRPASRRLGIFRALYAHARSAARLAGAVCVRLYVHHTNAPARATYHDLGMHDSGYVVMEEPLATPRP